jgi:hypothetical protein
MHEERCATSSTCEARLERLTAELSDSTILPCVNSRLTCHSVVLKSHFGRVARSSVLRYTDATSTQSTATGSADVPPLPPEAKTYSLTGLITEETTGSPIEGARVEIINGANVGKSTATDRSGLYELRDLVAETFRMRASGAGHDSSEQNVTVPDVPRADMALRPTPRRCVYTISPNETLNPPPFGAQYTLMISRMSGACGWQASTDANWIGLSTISGSGDASMTLTVYPYATNSSRTGVVTIDWNGGRTELTIRQVGQADFLCLASITVGGQNTLNVSASGGQYTATITPWPPSPGCGPWNASASPPGSISFVGSASGTSVPASVTFTVPSNVAHAGRALSVVINFTFGNPSAVLTVNQAGAP